MNPRHSSLSLIGSTILAAGLLAGCGSSTGSTAGGGAAPPADISYAKAQVVKYKAIPAFEPPGPTVDVSSLRGKTIYSIPIDTKTQFFTAVESAQKSVAEAAGLTYVTFPADGSITSYQQGIQQAVNAQAGAILLNGPLPGTLAPQVAAAVAAGIPVIPLHETDATGAQQTGVTAEAYAQFNLAAKLFTDAAIVDLAGKPVNALVIQSSETGPAAGMVKAIADELSAHGPAGSKSTVINVSVPQWSTQIQSQVQTALLRDPTINAVLPIYDSMAQYAAPGIRQAAAARDVGIYSFNGTPSILALLASGDTVRVDIGEDPAWIAHVAMDVTFRAILKQPAVPGETGPVRLIDKTNVAETGNPPQLGKGFGDAYVAGFQKLWGLG